MHSQPGKQPGKDAAGKKGQRADATIALVSDF